MRDTKWRRFLMRVRLLAGIQPGEAAPGMHALTADMAERIAKAVPNAKVKVAGPLSLKLSGPSGETQLNLDRIAAFCAANPAEEYETAKVRFIAGVVEAATSDDAITRERLRVIVRTSDYADDLQTLGSAFVTRPVGEGLVAILAADFPNTVGMVTTQDLASLQLDADEAFELGRKNVLEQLPKLPSAADLGEDAVTFAGQLYEASLLLADGWPQLARATSGKLFVTVAADDLVVIGLIDDEHVRRLREAVADDLRASERGISPEVYRWSDKGWTVAK